VVGVVGVVGWSRYGLPAGNSETECTFRGATNPSREFRFSERNGIGGEFTDAFCALRGLGVPVAGLFPGEFRSSERGGMGRPPDVAPLLV